MTSRSAALSRREAGLERCRVAVAETGGVFGGAARLALRREPLTGAAPALGAQVIERARAGDREQPAARACAARVEAVALAPGALERVGREVLGERAVAREVDEVAVDVAEMRLDELVEGLGSRPGPCA